MYTVHCLAWRLIMRTDILVSAIGYLAEVLCAPVGGVGTHPIDYNGTGNGTATNTTAGSPSPSPFTGGARQTGGGVTGMIVTGLASVVALLML